ncbi:hypothetical protein CCHR01_07258 [Colletotrichum chrysophilum]|uniref:Uncharacterized protein n=1 Tax=Colletotrichum chrysophilum TaxID=1836956 RepID=A0AAD9AKV7_9PEZI|nr:hypothetical protein CCHR01_07258 [Colletotrichum chrysophilum]
MSEEQHLLRRCARQKGPRSSHLRWATLEWCGGDDVKGRDEQESRTPCDLRCSEDVPLRTAKTGHFVRI